jgi:peptidylprolyl isomerase
MKTTIFKIAALVFLFNIATENIFSQSIVKITTDYGDIVVRLSDATPKHRDNFMKLVKNKFYDGAIFHRVIKDFMIQGGEKDSSFNMAKYNYLIDAEFVDSFIHKKGALAAARTGDQVNPKKMSSATQFYIVQGQVFTDAQLNSIEKSRTNELLTKAVSANMSQLIEKNKIEGKRVNNDSLYLVAINQAKSDSANFKPFKFTEKQRTAYKTLGGSPHLDGAYTVFGEVIEGLDVIDKIASVETNKSRPIKKVKMKMVVVKDNTTDNK